MEIKSKSIDGINEITYDTETGATTTTLLHNVENQIGFVNEYRFFIYGIGKIYDFI